MSVCSAMSSPIFRCRPPRPLQIRWKSKSLARWLDRQSSDVHTLQAKAEHYRSRAAYKLIEINDKFRVLRGSRRIVDLGFAPGAWTQVALEKCGRNNTNILGVDLIPCVPPEGALFIQGDIFSKKTHEQIVSHFGGEVDLVLSDMMANTSGIKDNDHYASMDLCDGVLLLSLNVLKKGGSAVMKFYTGKEDHILHLRLSHMFSKVYKMKPQACRNELREMYFIGVNKKNVAVEDVFSSP